MKSKLISIVVLALVLTFIFLPPLKDERTFYYIKTGIIFLVLVFSVIGLNLKFKAEEDKEKKYISIIITLLIALIILYRIISTHLL